MDEYEVIERVAPDYLPLWLPVWRAIRFTGLMLIGGVLGIAISIPVILILGAVL